MLGFFPSMSSWNYTAVGLQYFSTHSKILRVYLSTWYFLKGELRCLIWFWSLTPVLHFRISSQQLGRQLPNWCIQDLAPLARWGPLPLPASVARFWNKVPTPGLPDGKTQARWASSRPVQDNHNHRHLKGISQILDCHGLRASHLVGRCCRTWNCNPALAWTCSQTVVCGNGSTQNYYKNKGLN